MARGRRLALLGLAALLAGCGGSSGPPTAGPVLRLAIAREPATLDPALVADLPSLNVAHELYAGLTRFSEDGVEPDLARSWDTSEDGLVWTFHLRDGLRWSDDRPLTAQDFRRSWLRALSPATRSAYARAEMQNIRGARRYRVTGSGPIGVEAVDDRTLRVTLQHPVPWLDEQVAWPVFFPVRVGGRATSGPFRLADRSPGRVVLERNFNYWDADSVKPRRIVLTTSTEGVDGVLPRGVVPPGFPWIETAGRPPAGSRRLPTLAVRLLWLVTRGTQLADPGLRRLVAGSLGQSTGLVPPAIPGAAAVSPRTRHREAFTEQALRLTLAYTPQDSAGPALASEIRDELAQNGVRVTLKPVATLQGLLKLAGPPAQPGVDMVLLGWSSEFFDAYNILDLFPCGSAFNVAQWCDRAFDAGMRRAVRTLDDDARRQIERRLVGRLEREVPAVALGSPSDHVRLRPGIEGFRWSPIGFYELLGMTRS